MILLTQRRTKGWIRFEYCVFRLVLVAFAVWNCVVDFKSAAEYRAGRLTPDHKQSWYVFLMVTAVLGTLVRPAKAFRFAWKCKLVCKDNPNIEMVDPGTGEEGASSRVVDPYTKEVQKCDDCYFYVQVALLLFEAFPHAVIALFGFNGCSSRKFADSLAWLDKAFDINSALTLALIIKSTFCCCCGTSRAAARVLYLFYHVSWQSLVLFSPLSLMLSE